MSVRLVAAAALYLCVASPSVAASPAISATAVDPHLEKALALARLAQPEDMVVDRSMSTLDAQIVPALLRTSDYQKLEQDYPGITRAMWNAGRPLVRQALTSRLPDLWQAMARVYAAHFTDVQLVRLTAFFSGPTARKFMRQMRERSDTAPLLDRAISSGSVDAQSYKHDTDRAADAAMNTMSDSELREVGAFFNSDLGPGMRSAAGEVMQAVVEWMNKRDAAAHAQIEHAMVAAASKYKTEHPASAAQPR